MNQFNRFNGTYLVALAIILAGLTGCVPMRTQTATKPTLDEVRLGRVAGAPALDLALTQGEVRAEVVRVDPVARAAHVRTDDGRTEVLLYDVNRTKVLYHGSTYTPATLQSGDIIAFRPPPRDKEVDVIRIQAPVQARADSPALARPAAPAPPRTHVIEGTVDRIQHERGVFDVIPRTGRRVTVSLPFNATPAIVESFRRLRPGDPVRIEGEFVNPETVQLLSFVPRGR